MVELGHSLPSINGHSLVCFSLSFFLYVFLLAFVSISIFETQTKRESKRKEKLRNITNKIGMVCFTIGPAYWTMPYFGDLVRWTSYHTLQLYPDSYRDPLIPPPDVWTEKHNHFIKSLEIRKERMTKIKKEEEDYQTKFRLQIEDMNKRKEEKYEKEVEKWREKMPSIMAYR